LPDWIVTSIGLIACELWKKKAEVENIPPPLNYPHIIRYDLIGVDIKLPLFDPGAGDVSSLLTVIVIVFGVSVVNIAAATLWRCACLDAGLSECLFVQLVKACNELSCH
jgi:hypothetical protein